jgi:hypothetical protein
MVGGCRPPNITQSKFFNAVQGQDTLVRDDMSKGRNIPGPHHPREALSKGQNVQDSSFGETLFGDTPSCHPSIIYNADLQDYMSRKKRRSGFPEVLRYRLAAGGGRIIVV